MTSVVDDQLCAKLASLLAASWGSLRQRRPSQESALPLTDKTHIKTSHYVQCQFGCKCILALSQISFSIDLSMISRRDVQARQDGTQRCWLYTIPGCCIDFTLDNSYFLSHKSLFAGLYSIKEIRVTEWLDMLGGFSHFKEQGTASILTISTINSTFLSQFKAVSTAVIPSQGYCLCPACT